MGLLDFFNTKQVVSQPADWTTILPREVVDEILADIKANPQSCRTDVIPQGYGEFGLEKNNPIPVYGIPSNHIYLQSLRTSTGDILRFRRTGSIEVENIYNPVDEYEIFNNHGETIAFIYLSPYHWTTSQKSPFGFHFKGDSARNSKTTAHPVEVFNQHSAYSEFQAKLQKNEEIKYQEQKRRNDKYKPDWERFREVMAANQIHTLYHFTDRSNLESIKKHGALYSWYHCSTNNISIPIPGGNQLSRDLDTRKGLQDYVRVSFTRCHPMMFVEPIRNRNNVILELETEVVYWKGTKYADKNATRNDVNIGASLKDFNQLRFDLFKGPNHFSLSDNDKPFFQGEILVPNSIPARYIRNLNQLITQDDFC